MRQDIFEKLKTFILELVSVGIELIFSLEGLFEDIFFENTCSFDTIWEDHDTHSVLNTLIPDSHVGALIGPLHDSIPMAFIFLVISFIPVATLPFEDTPSVLLVMFVQALIRVTFRVSKFISLLFLPFTMAVFESVHELACIATAILPLILAKSLRLSLCILTNITVAICKKV